MVANTTLATPGSTPPALAQYVAGTDGTNARALKTNANGELRTVTTGKISGVTEILNRTSIGAGTGYNPVSDAPGFVAKVTGTGAVSATIVVQASADNSTWFELGTIIVSGTTSAADGFAPPRCPYPWVRGDLTAISGTGATATLVVCE